MSFYTVINCIDGRAQLPAISYLQTRFEATYVDVVTEAGPVGVLALLPESEMVESMYRRVEVSIQAHSSRGIIIVAHYDCAGNPVPDSEQIKQLQQCAQILSERYPTLDIAGLWLDQDFEVHEISTRGAAE